MELRKIYGIEQYGGNDHEHRFLVDSDSNLGKRISAALEKGEGFYYYNGAECVIKEFSETDLPGIREFLTAPNSGVDMDNPSLIAIIEYLLTVDTGYDMVTQEFLDKLELKQEDLIQRDERLEELIHRYQLKDSDINDFFYGENGDRRYDEMPSLEEYEA